MGVEVVVEGAALEAGVEAGGVEVVDGQEEAGGAGVPGIPFLEDQGPTLGYPSKRQIWSIIVPIQGTSDIHERILKIPLEFL